MSAALLDPGAVTLIESTFLTHLQAGMEIVAQYAFNLLYLFAVLELVLLGLVWALQKNLAIEKIFFKVIKIGLIFFIIKNYELLISVILNSLAKISGIVIDNSEVTQYLFNPAQIWQYGYDVGINLLNLASTTDTLGLSMLQLLLGYGILLIFGLLGIQLITQIITYYFVSLSVLIVLPFGAFNSSRKMFDRAVQSVLQAGLRLMSLMVIIGIAVITWSDFDLKEMTSGSNFNLNQPLGLFFTALLFLSLAHYIPKVLAQIIGEIGSDFLEPNLSVDIANSPGSTFISSPLSSETADLKAATTISLESLSGSQGNNIINHEATSASAVEISPNIAGLANKFGNTNKGELSTASKLAKSISDTTAKKIKEDLLKTLGNKN